MSSQVLRSCTKDANRHIHACHAPVAVTRARAYTQTTRTIREGAITPTVALSVNIVWCSYTNLCVCVCVYTYTPYPPVTLPVV